LGITRRRALRIAGGLVLLEALPRAALAAQLDFIPITITTSLGQSASTIEVANRGGGASTLQVRAFSWQQPPDGSDALVPSDQIAVSPPIFSLPEGQSQVIRVVLHTPPGPTELAFRVLVDELPPPNATNVQLALRVSLPIFATPASGVADLHWQVVRAAGGLRITAHNMGALHSRVSKLTLAMPARAPVEAKLENRLPYVLPGAERHWSAALPAPAGTQVTLTADIDGKTFALSLPVGA
jgi:fimbrial chaperone protein